MDEGRIAGTTEILDASLISHVDRIEEIVWECPGCTALLWPAAWHPGRSYRVLAYFRIRDGEEHHGDCLYRDRSVGSRSGRTSARGARRMVGPVIGMVDMTEPAPSSGLGTAGGRRRDPGPPRLVDHVGSRRSIAAVAAIHARGIEDGTLIGFRGVPGLARSTYGRAFSRVARRGPNVRLHRIWFGELRIRQKIDRRSDVLTVAFAVACDDGDGREGPVGIEVDMRGWSTFQRAVFVDRLESALERAVSEHAERRTVTRLYVLAPRVAEDPCRIAIDHPKRLAIVGGRGIRSLRDRRGA